MPTLATPLDNFIRDREPFGSTHFNVMKFLDPRLKHRLSAEEENEAIKLIVKIHERLFPTAQMDVEATSTSDKTSGISLV